MWALLAMHFEKASEKVKSSSGKEVLLQNRQEMERPIFHVDLILYFLPNGGNAYFVHIRHSNLVQKILSACLKPAYITKYHTLTLWI